MSLSSDEFLLKNMLMKNFNSLRPVITGFQHIQEEFVLGNLTVTTQKY